MTSSASSSSSSPSSRPDGRGRSEADMPAGKGKGKGMEVMRRRTEEKKVMEKEGHEGIPQPEPNDSLPLLILRYASLAAILAAWWWMTSLETKLRAAMVAITFSIIEFHFRAITHPSPAEMMKKTTTIIRNDMTTMKEEEEEVEVTSDDAANEAMSAAERDMRRAMGLPMVPPAYASVMKESSSSSRWERMMRTVRARACVSHVLTYGHTTWEQFWANVFWGPIMNDFYHDALFALLLPSFSAWPFLAQAGLRALLYPINIWVAEVVMGYYLTYVWRRRAWLYRGRWAMLDGNITVAYGPLWNLLGGLYEVGYPLLYRPVPGLIASLVR